MSERQHHCPFLNRSDERCSSNFSLDRLQHAFEYCFDEYKACPQYAAMLKERTERREAAAAASAGGVGVAAATGVSSQGADGEEGAGSGHVVLPSRLVQVSVPRPTITGRLPKRLAAYRVVAQELASQHAGAHRIAS